MYCAVTRSRSWKGGSNFYFGFRAPTFVSASNALLDLLTRAHLGGAASPLIVAISVSSAFRPNLAHWILAASSTKRMAARAHTSSIF